MHTNWAKSLKTLAPAGVVVYRMKNNEQPEIEDFYLPFGGHLNKENRWVILGNKIPWDKLEEEYAAKFSDSGMGAPAKPLRVALASLIIKEKLQISDREVVEQIRETPYLQYFLGFNGYRDEDPFDASLMVYFRKRLDGELIHKANEILVSDYKEKLIKKKRKMKKKLKEMRR